MIITLPEESLRVKTFGYAHGFSALPDFLAQQYAQLPQGHELTASLTTDAAQIGLAGRHLAETLLERREMETNEPALFVEAYTQSFIEGYHFCAYAAAHGILEALMPLSEKALSNAGFIFAWNHFRPDDQQEPDEDENREAITAALDMFTAIYRQYKALN